MNPHPDRPAPPHNDIVASTDYGMFWSLSFAVSAATWEHIGGCCELYRGYGGEDTDFAQCAAAGGVTMHWVGGTDAFHQYHPVSNPPIEHLDDILCNAAVFHQRWGWWPMEGWLHEFENRGLIRRDAAGRPHRLGAAPRHRGRTDRSDGYCHRLAEPNINGGRWSSMSVSPGDVWPAAAHCKRPRGELPICGQGGAVSMREKWVSDAGLRTWAQPLAKEQQ